MALSGLLHPQVDADLDDVSKELESNGQYRPVADARRLRPHERISDVWSERPRSDHLHVFVRLLSVVSTAGDTHSESFMLRIAPAQDARLKMHAHPTQPNGPNLMTLTSSFRILFLLLVNTRLSFQCQADSQCLKLEMIAS